MWSLGSDSVQHVSDLRVHVIDLISQVVEQSADELISERWKPVLDDARAAISRRLGD
jgi:hypothetical protein